jgi:AhpD family alkylhydroperoxidase
MKADLNSSEYLKSSLEIIRWNIEAYRAGCLACYRVLAVELRLLLCDRKREHSRWGDTALVATLYPHLRWQAPLPVDTDPLEHLSISDGPEFSLAEWLASPIYSTCKRMLTIRDLIKIICEKDGGAHADPAGIPWPSEETPIVARLTCLVAEAVYLKLTGAEAARQATCGTDTGVNCMTNRIDDFIAYRQKMNERILDIDHLGIKRFFNLDSAAYQNGALDEKTKELLGLVASMVLRCNDCIDYHILECIKVGWSDAEIIDAMNVALVVGGSIVIPHLRHAVESLDLARVKLAEE